MLDIVQCAIDIFKRVIDPKEQVQMLVVQY